MPTWKSPFCFPFAGKVRSTAGSTHRGLMLRCSWLLAVAIVTAASSQAQTHGYRSIVVFGDSLSDTGNFADLTQAKYGFRVPGPIADYTNGRFTDGIDTIPYARRFDGVWIEQLAAMLPARPAVKASLDGGTNYAYGDATADGGSGVIHFGPGGFYSVTVNNIGQQITDYLAHHPKITPGTLFVLWGGANDVLNATSSTDVIDAAIDEAANVNRLAAAGATQFLVLNLPPLGDAPGVVGTPASTAANQASVLFNSTLSAALDLVTAFHAGRHLHVHRLNVFSLLQSVVASPAKFALTNVTQPSQGMIAVNPDQYLFWDDQHPTTAAHHILALAALKLLDPERCEIVAGPWVQPQCDVIP